MRARRRRSRRFVILRRRIARFDSPKTPRRRLTIGTRRASTLTPRTIPNHLLPPRETIKGGVESATNRRSNSREVVGRSSRLRSLLDVFLRHDERIGTGGIGIGEPSFGRFEISQNPRMLLRTSSASSRQT